MNDKKGEIHQRLEGRMEREQDSSGKDSFQKNKVNDRKVIPDPIDDRKFQE